jgi:DHA1 family multidrug resistance protein-like MFS transporter
MFDIFRESTFGVLLNRFSGGRIMRYPDQRPDFVVPERFTVSFSPVSGSAPVTRTASPASPEDRISVRSGTTAAASHMREVGTDASQSDGTLEAGAHPPEPAAEFDTKGFQIVDWYGDDDQENPRNWSMAKRCFVMCQIVLLTCVVLFHSNGLGSKSNVFDLVVSLSTLDLPFTRRLLHMLSKSSTFPKSRPL